jgi:hypothetical protein
MVSARSSKTDALSVAVGDVGGDVGAATAQVLHEGVTVAGVCAERWRFRPRIGRSRAFRLSMVCPDRIVRVLLENV